MRDDIQRTAERLCGIGKWSAWGSPMSLEKPVAIHAMKLETALLKASTHSIQVPHELPAPSDNGIVRVPLESDTRDVKIDDQLQDASSVVVILRVG
jgi:hypothetical protein